MSDPMIAPTHIRRAGHPPEIPVFYQRLRRERRTVVRRRRQGARAMQGLLVAT